MTAASRRFFKTVDICPTPAGHTIRLDGREVKTPRGRPLAVPSVALAGLIAAEWQAQGAKIRPETMKMTGLSNSTIDRVLGSEPAIVDGIATYLPTDLVLYRAESPEDLSLREARFWDPPLVWLSQTHDITLIAGSGIRIAPQDGGALARARKLIAGRDCWSLACLSLATAFAGSAVLGLALLEGAMTEEDFFSAVFVDEIFQAEHWGNDREALARRERLRAELRDLMVFHAAQGSRDG